jgi:hypothetical protein
MYRLSRPASTRVGEAEAPERHVIEEYKHRAQTVTCVCGWHGSTAQGAAERSEWQMHLAENRPKPK